MIFSYCLCSLAGPRLTYEDLERTSYDVLGLNRTNGLMVFTPYFSTENPSTELINKANNYYTMTLATVILISAPFSLALSALVWVQTYNMIFNTTTSQRYSKYAKQQMKKVEEGQKELIDEIKIE